MHSAYWYGANWLQGCSAGNAGRPALPAATMARILNLDLATKMGEEAKSLLRLHLECWHRTVRGLARVARRSAPSRMRPLLS
jgi:hypothetical protein